MAIAQITEFQVNSLKEEPDQTPRMQLKNQHSKQTIELPGKILEAQFAVDKHYLLFLTEGNPFEEALYICYLDHDLQLIETLELSAIYAEGMLRDLDIASTNSVQFSFFDPNEIWLLSILPEPTFSLRGNTPPVKRKSPLLSKHFLMLKKCKNPDR